MIFAGEDKALIRIF